MVKIVLEERLSQALNATRVVEVVRSSQEDGSIKLLFRVTQKRVWLAILEYALARASTWSAHICQQYFMRNGKLVYGWNFILRPAEGVNLDEAVSDAGQLLVQAARTAPQVMAKTDADSFPLVGYSPRRTAKLVFDPRMPGPDRGGPSHKGAYPITSKG